MLFSASSDPPPKITTVYPANRNTVVGMWHYVYRSGRKNYSNVSKYRTWPSH